MHNHSQGEANNNWQDSYGNQWKNSTDNLCWRSASWTPATAATGCDGALKVEPVATIEEVIVVPESVIPEPVIEEVEEVAVVIVPEKVEYAADTFFDFDQYTLKPEGKNTLDDLANTLSDVAIEVIIATGHTDSTGPASYNQKLSLQRANAVRDYLVNQGINANLVYTEGMGERSPVATNRTPIGRAMNRRVDIEVVGTVTPQQ
jgi:OOP family OmpA-OmpF porin